MVEKLYRLYHNGQPLPVGPMTREPAVGLIIDFSNYHLNNELPTICFQVVSTPVPIQLARAYYKGRDFGYTSDTEEYRIDVEKSI